MEQLEKIWEFRTGDVPENDKPFGNQNTPIKVGDRLYLCSALNKISALDAATGAEFWIFDPKTPSARLSAALSLASHGLSREGEP